MQDQSHPCLWSICHPWSCTRGRRGVDDFLLPSIDNDDLSGLRFCRLTKGFLRGFLGFTVLIAARAAARSARLASIADPCLVAF